MKQAFIKAISYYLPERVVTNEELVKEFPEWSVDKVAQKVGVDSRHLAAPNETAGDMAEKVARLLFEEYIIDPKSIDFLLLCTQSPDYFLPAPIGTGSGGHDRARSGPHGAPALSGIVFQPQRRRYTGGR